MRLHRLAVSAFGPFAGTEEIDFDALSGGGLFLLHGATGAGKTSILDAVCFALYGDVPGVRQKNALRSHHVRGDAPTEVVLDFTVRGRRLEITRSPAYHVRRRGRGGAVRETPVKARTLLREWKGEWTDVSVSHQEIGEEIGRLMGMSREQFCQVVLLPQGDFARFLRGDAKERAALLRQLFDTHRFSEVEEWLAARRLGSHKAARAAIDEVLHLLHRLHQAAGSGEQAPSADAAASWPGLVEDALVTAARLRVDAAERAAHTAAALAFAEERHRAAGRAAERVRALADRQERHRRAGRRAAELDAAEEEMRALAARLERARRADRVLPLWQVARDAEAEHRAAAGREERARAALAAAGGGRDRAGTGPGRAGLAGAGPDAVGLGAADLGAADLDAAVLDGAGPAGAGPTAAGTTGTDLAGTEPTGTGPAGTELTEEALTEAEAALRQELVRLEDAAAAEQEQRRAAGERDQLRREAERAEAEQAEAARWLADWPRLRAAAAERLRTAEDAAQRAAVLADRLATATARLEAARRADDLRGALAAAEEERRRALDEAAGARESWLTLRESRLDGMAAELAAGLAVGDPCPVCGSAEHPAPARPAPGQVTRADEEAAERAYRRLDRAREQAEESVRALGRDAAAAHAAAGGLDAGELADQAGALAREHAGARDLAAGAVAAAQDLERLEEEHARRLEERRRAGERHAAGEARLEDLDREQRRLAERLARARGTDPSIAARAARLTALADRHAAAAAAVREAGQARDRAASAAARACAAAREAGFAAPAEAAGAALDPAAQRRALQRLEDHRAELAAVRAALAEPALAAAAAEPPADPDAAAAHLDRATAALRRAAAGHEAALARCAELERLGRALARQARRVAPLLEEHALARSLADLASGGGDNTLRMRLESYVLAARLEQVAAAASHRLQLMSGGRYTLVHSDEKAGGTKRSGLGLRVVDAWTGTARDTASLSGGESFFASLALALGLADVVTHETGGIRLDTLFIDEGFGTLDPQALDDVLDVLDALRERDRAVGIVSHVPELRQRIPTQLSVARGRHGSTVKVSLPAG